jgi:hypothetical protein
MWMDELGDGTLTRIDLSDRRFVGQAGVEDGDG